MKGMHWYYTAMAALGLLHVFVFSLMLRPSVSDEYRDYYITRETTLSPMQRRNLTPIEPGEYFDHHSTAVGFDGWSFAERDHRWSLGSSAKLIFLLEEIQGSEVAQHLVLRFATLGEQTVQIFLNDEPLLERRFDGAGEVELRIPVPDSLLQEGENIVRFDLPDARQPGNGDARILAVALRSFSLS
ncbi:MAG: hypothetical protein Q8L60_07720 [Gammaproteobacteria bacterium]|nr:hypothetical protein [Gammaproteobacteria bacterium]MDP2142151.1 hypothetical protein [Gammaproteobacteria bacterium]MDP2348241.1 hypothetical protein [Gammaproteobacteria bacterium]